MNSQLSSAKQVKDVKYETGSEGEKHIQDQNQYEYYDEEDYGDQQDSQEFEKDPY